MLGNNRHHNANNPGQGDFKRVLCICSAGIFRSPTAAEVLTQEYGYNCRSVGAVRQFAPFQLDTNALWWADEIVCMEQEHVDLIHAFHEPDEDTPIIVLDIPDHFEFRDPKLIELIKQKYAQHLEDNEQNS